MKVLVTCGPTWVAIDSVRVISNQSTGAMGHAIAQEFQKSGAKVTLIEGPVTHAMDAQGIRVLKYRFFDELALALNNECPRHDVLIHAAAVSDFKPAHERTGKISSDKTLTLKLVPAGKLINAIKARAPRIFLVGFKLENTVTAARAFRISRPLFEKAKCDLVVANSLEQGYRGFIVAPGGRILARASSKASLAKVLMRSIP